MAIERRVCADLAPPPAYSHVVTARGATSVWTAGAVPLDAAGELVGAGDHRARAGQVLDNLLVALRAAGAGPEHVVKATVYVVGDQAALVDVWKVVRESPVGAAEPATPCWGLSGWATRPAGRDRSGRGAALTRNRALRKGIGSPRGIDRPTIVKIS